MPDVALIEIGCERPELNEPIGLCTVAAFLAADNALTDSSVKLFWQKIPSRRATMQALEDAVLIGLSSQINSLAETRELYSEIRRHYPSIPIMIGNLLAIYASQELLEAFPDSILCIGEGEVSFSEVYKIASRSSGAALDRRSLREIPNLMFIDGDEIVKTPSRLVDVTKLPTPRRDFVNDLIALGGITRIEGSRGCHWGRCEFCSVASRFGLGGYRRFIPSRIVSDLEILGALGARSPYFSDEDFFGGKYAASREVAEAIIQAKASKRIPADMNFFVSVLASDVKHPEGYAALQHWKIAGLREVFVGIEAGAEDEIKRFVKKSNAGTNSTAVHRLLDLEFQVDIGFIMFDPMMTLSDLEQNVRWLQNQPLEEIDARVTKSLRIQPRTGLQEKYRSLITGPLNVDELTYPAIFSDEHVARIERRFREWEALCKPDVYALLGAGRGEMHDEPSRITLKRGLAKIRDLDLEYLSSLITFERGENSIALVDDLGRRLNEKKRAMLRAFHPG